MNKILDAIAKALIWACKKTGRVLYITGTSPDDIYLIRYFVVKSRWFNFFIHIFLRSDKDDMHDHPWNFCTYLVKGAYNEEMPKSGHNVSDFIRRTRNISQNRFVTKKAEDVHRVMLDKPFTYQDRDQAPLTFCFTGRARRDWGFVKADPNGTSQEWMNWKKYLGLPEDTPGRG